MELALWPLSSPASVLRPQKTPRDRNAGGLPGLKFGRSGHVMGRFLLFHLSMKKTILLLTIAALGGGGYYAYTHKMFGLGGGAAKTEQPSAASTVMAEIRDIDYKVVVSG